MVDDLDKKILQHLMSDTSISYADLGKLLFVSGGTIHVRIKKLREQGIIIAEKIEVDYAKLGYDLTVFLGIFLEKSSLYSNVILELKKIPEIVGAHYTTGNYSIFTKLICKDTNHLRDVLVQKIQPIVGIQRTETFLSLEESINRPLAIDTEK